MGEYRKTGKEAKSQALIMIDGYIKGFAEIEPESEYWNGYRAALKAMRESIASMEVGEDDDRNSKVTLL